MVGWCCSFGLTVFVLWCDVACCWLLLCLLVVVVLVGVVGLWLFAVYECWFGGCGVCCLLLMIVWCGFVDCVAIGLLWSLLYGC